MRFHDIRYITVKSHLQVHISHSMSLHCRTGLKLEVIWRMSNLERSEGEMIRNPLWKHVPIIWDHFTIYSNYIQSIQSLTSPLSLILSFRLFIDHCTILVNIYRFLVFRNDYNYELPLIDKQKKKLVISKSVFVRLVYSMILK